MKVIQVLVSLLIVGMVAQAGASLVLTPASAVGVLPAPGQHAPGFEFGAWQADPTTSNGKSEFYIPITSLFSTPVAIGDIASMSYWTNKSGGPGDPDWSLYLYTAPTGTDDLSSWYKSRITAEPYYSINKNGALADQWNQWSTAAGNNQLRFYEKRSGTAGTNSDPTWDVLSTAPVTWGNNVTRDYTAETVGLISFQTGSGWATGFNGLLDGFTITLKNGDTATINFEAPEPGTFALLGLPLLGLAFWRRRYL